VGLGAKPDGNSIELITPMPAVISRLAVWAWETGRGGAFGGLDLKNAQPVMLKKIGSKAIASVRIVFWKSPSRANFDSMRKDESDEVSAN
jgi:hypothetical protein